MRVYELAKKLGVSSKAISEVAGVGSASSGLTDEQVATLTEMFAKPKRVVEQHRIAAPAFDQSQPWHEVREKDIRRIVQGKAYFTYGEPVGDYDHKISQNKLVPTPEFVKWID